ncbi:MAG: hypothetical protein HKN15_08605 [Xanthomonadales bacterium]|nr:hypothetical protein [Xanthomonadales bacterium]
MEQSIRNIIAVYNDLLPTTGNLRPSQLPGQVDFESVALHELGHCIGKAHVNLASESGLGEPDRNYTKSTDGVNDGTTTPGNFDLNTGVDGTRGSRDDIRGDDNNLFWFRNLNNNPFTMDYSTIDSTTYSRDLSNLPAGDSYAANGDWDVADSELATPNTEAVMQQGSFFTETQRTLTHDGVATLRYAMSGADEIEGTADDYTFQLNFATSGCDINMSFDDGQTGFAVCQTSAAVNNDVYARIASANAYFNTGYNWHFNTATPCTETVNLVQNQWLMFSPACYLGISTGNTVADILGAGLDYGVDVVILEYDAVSEAYVQLVESSEIVTGGGYFVYTNEAGRTLDIDGQFNGSPDMPLTGAGTPMSGGRFNLIGHPYDFDVPWSEVQIVDGANVEALAAAVSDEDISRTYYVWNGSSYDPFVDTTPGMVGTLTPGMGIWVEAYKPGIRLRVPSTGPASPSPTGPSSLAGESRIETVASARSKKLAQKVDGEGSWFVRVIAESGALRDAGNVFGQLVESSDGPDIHDIKELEPFSNPHLSVVFPHEEWGETTWGYASDYHAATRKPSGEWVFAVRGSEPFAEVTLKLEGPAEILKKGNLRDLESGKQVKLADGSYTFDMASDVHYFSFRLRRK